MCPISTTPREGSSDHMIRCINVKWVLISQSRNHRHASSQADSAVSKIAGSVQQLPESQVVPEQSLVTDLSLHVKVRKKRKEKRKKVITNQSRVVRFSACWKYTL